MRVRLGSARSRRVASEYDATQRQRGTDNGEELKNAAIIAMPSVASDTRGDGQNSYGILEALVVINININLLYPIMIIQDNHRGLPRRFVPPYGHRNTPQVFPTTSS
jgi:hypothetical protein